MFPVWVEWRESIGAALAGGNALGRAGLREDLVDALHDAPLLFGGRVVRIARREGLRRAL